MTGAEESVNVAGAGGVSGEEFGIEWGEWLVKGNDRGELGGDNF